MKKAFLAVMGVFFFIFAVVSFNEEPRLRAESSQSLAAPKASEIGLQPDFGKMPLYFIANQGQMDERVTYYVQGKDKTLYFTPGGVTIVLNSREDQSGRASEPRSQEKLSAENGGERLKKGELAESSPSERWVVKLDFVGANWDVKPVGVEKTEAVISYFKGKQEDWKTGLPTFSQIVYPNLWPGIDLVYSGSMNKLKYEFIVHPGADPSNIRLAYRGVTQLSVIEDGQLEVKTPLGGFYDDFPVAYQEVRAKRINVALGYRLESAAEEGGSCPESQKEVESQSWIYGFQVGDYDRSQPLVLDPAIIVYCGYIGGSSLDYGWGIAVDSSGNTYIAGSLSSSESSFPETVGPDLTYNGGTDAFVAKVNASGTGLAYCGYIGGSDNDSGLDIAVDSSGSAYVTGHTFSDQSTFPVTGGPDLTHNGGRDAFVAKVNASGTGLTYCGYIGGSNNEMNYSIAVDNFGNAYISGQTFSDQSTFLVTGGPDLTYNGNGDAFVAKVNASGTGLAYCGYIGGSDNELVYGIAVDSSGNAYISGKTLSDESSFPVTVGPDLTHNGGWNDAFVAKVNASGTGLAYCGYIGGSSDDQGQGIAVDISGNAYITGYTFSDESSFPVTVGPDLTYNDGQDAFVAKVNAAGDALSYCGYIGGLGEDWGKGISVDSSASAYIAGQTYSDQSTFPVVTGPDVTYNGGDHDAFVAKVNAAGTGLTYCGYIGGTEDDTGYDMAVDSSGNAYITGGTVSTESSFPVMVGPDLIYNGGTADAFVAKVSIPKDDFIGTWDGQGVYYRNSETGKWIKLASPADLVAAGDLGGDGIDDLITVFPSVAGVWTRSSSAGTWAKLSSTTAKHISSGDMNGDGRVDLLATWDGVGVYYRNSISGAWTKIAQPANLIAAGDLDGDSKDDPIVIFPTPAGVWVKYSKTGTWAKLSSTTARDIASGDMNGDARDDLLATWDGTGVYYRNSISGAWVKMSQPADQVTAGDIDGDGADDLITSSAPGVYVKSSKTGTWTKLGNAAKDIAAGLMRGGIWGSGAFGFLPLDLPIGGYAESSIFLSRYEDLSAQGPGGWRFAAQEEKNLVPLETAEALASPGPGDPGFVWIEEDNLFPQEQEKAAPEKRQKRRGMFRFSPKQ